MREISVDELLFANRKYEKSKKILPKFFLVRNLCLRFQLCLKQESFSISSKNKPIKKYEIYRICINMKEEFFVADKCNLPIDETNSQDLYFDKNIALQICKILNNINDNALKSCHEIMEEYQYEIIKKEEEIEKLKKLDELRFEEALYKYRLIEDKVLKENKNKYEILQEENEYLRRELKKYKLSNNRLIKRLDISLSMYEELIHKKDNFFNKIIYRLNIIKGGKIDGSIHCKKNMV